MADAAAPPSPLPPGLYPAAPLRVANPPVADHAFRAFNDSFDVDQKMCDDVCATAGKKCAPHPKGETPCLKVNIPDDDFDPSQIAAQCSCVPSKYKSTDDEATRVKCCLGMISDTQTQCAPEHAWDHINPDNTGGKPNGCGDVMTDWCGTVVEHVPGETECKLVAGGVQPAYCMRMWTKGQDGASCRQWAEWVDPDESDKLVTSYCNVWTAGNKHPPPECVAVAPDAVPLATAATQCRTYHDLSTTFAKSYGSAAWNQFAGSQPCWYAPIAQRSALTTGVQRNADCPSTIACDQVICHMENKAPGSTTINLVNECGGGSGSASGSKSKHKSSDTADAALRMARDAVGVHTYAALARTAPGQLASAAIRLHAAVAGLTDKSKTKPKPRGWVAGLVGADAGPNPGKPADLPASWASAAAKVQYTSSTCAGYKPSDCKILHGGGNSG